MVSVSYSERLEEENRSNEDDFEKVDVTTEADVNLCSNSNAVLDSALNVLRYMSKVAELLLVSKSV